MFSHLAHDVWTSEHVFKVKARMCLEKRLHAFNTVLQCNECNRGKQKHYTYVGQSIESISVSVCSVHSYYS